MHTPAFLPSEEVARLAARMLLEVGAVNCRAEEPYVLTSGLASPVYIDCRKLIAYPRVRGALMDFAVATLAREAGFEAFDAVAGGETAGIPFAAWIAERTGLPMQYVRKKPKGFGRGARIEGDLREGQRVLLVEDLATDAGSKVGFAEALREAGGSVAHTFVIFYYDVFPGAAATLERAGLALHRLTTWREVLAESREAGHFDEPTHAAVEAFLDDPLGWSERHGGSYAPVG